MTRLTNLLLAGSILTSSFPSSLCLGETTQHEVAIRDTTVTNVTVIDISTGDIISTGGSFTDVSITDVSIHTRGYTDEVVLGVIAANAAVFAGVLTCTLALPACLGIGVAAVLTNFLTVWYFAGHVKRDGDEAAAGDTVTVHPDFQASGSCSAGCQFVAKAPVNTWAALATGTLDSVAYDLYAFHDGKEGGVRGLRAVPSGSTSSSSSSRRQIETDYDGFTAEYYFYDGTKTAWDDFVADYDGSTSDTATAFGNIIANFAVANNAQIMCADLADTDGIVATGLWVFDSDNTYDVLTVATAESYLATCKAKESAIGY